MRFVLASRNLVNSMYPRHSDTKMLMVCIVNARVRACVHTYWRGLRCCCLDTKAIPEPLLAEQQDCSPAFFVCVHEWRGPSQSGREQAGTKLKESKVKKGTGCEGSELGNGSRLDRDFLENGSKKSEKRPNGQKGPSNITSAIQVGYKYNTR